MVNQLYASHIWIHPSNQSSKLSTMLTPHLSSSRSLTETNLMVRVKAISTSSNLLTSKPYVNYLH